MRPIGLKPGVSHIPPWVFSKIQAPVFSVFHPRGTLKHNTRLPASPILQIHKSRGIGYGMNSVGSAKLGVITLSR